MSEVKLILFGVLISSCLSAQTPGDIRNTIVSTGYIDIYYECDQGKILVYLWEDDKIVFCDTIRAGEKRKVKTVSNKVYKSKCYGIHYDEKVQLFDYSKHMFLDKQGRIPIGYDRTHLTTCTVNKA